MMNCNNYFDMTDQGDSFETWQGLRGPAGPAGPAGAPGAPGSSVELRGPVATVGDLPATAPADELWMVGAESPYTGYFWNGSAWIDLGAILQGPQGEPGEDGVSPEIEIEQITGGHTVTITDAEHPSGQSFNVMDGADGAPGQPGTPGAPGAAAGFGTPTATVDGNVGTPSVTVTASGPDTAKVFAFAFSNLKGEPGSGGGGPDPYTSNPADLAASASPGSASQYSRGDHAHKLPTAAQIGAYVKPSGGIPASDLASGVIPSVPSAYTSNPEMDGTASPGSSTAWAKGDHVHPHDTSKADTGLGITGATVGKVPVISAVDGNGVPTAFDAGDGGDVTADMLGIVVNGNSTPVGASVEQYVIVKNSTISGITDGLYTAAQEIHANTAIDSTYLTPVSDGGMNDLLSRTQRHLLWTNASPASDFAAQTVSLDLSVYDLVFIEYAQDKLNDNYYYSYFFKIDGKIHMAIGFAGGKMARRFNTVNASGIYFGEGQIASTYASTFTTANTNMIPINIYGIK